MFFCNLSKEIEKKLIPCDKDFSHYLKDPANTTFYMSPTNAQEVEREIKNSKNQ